MDSPLRTLISQYANAPTLTQLIVNANGYIDPRANFDAFVRLVWDLRTAEGIGLDIWGRIVGIGRTLSIANPPGYFGFGSASPDYTPFNDGPFWDGTPVTANYVLADDAYRTLIFIKAAANIAATNTPALNRLLRSIFAGRGRAYVSDLGAMQMRLTFEFYLAPFEMALLAQSGSLPRPAGVGTYLLQAGGGTFGFAEAGPSAQPFNQGAFLAQENLINVS